MCRQRAVRARAATGSSSLIGRWEEVQQAQQAGSSPAFNSFRTAILQPPSLCRRVQQFIRQAYKEDWLCWSHEPEFGEEGEADGEEEGRLAAWLGGGGFTLRRK